MSALRTMMLFQSSSALLNSTRASIIPCRFPTRRGYVGFKAVRSGSYSSSSAVTLADNSKEDADGGGDTQQARAISLLEKLRSRHLKDFQLQNAKSKSKSDTSAASKRESKKTPNPTVSSFGEMGLSEEIMRAVQELSISVPTEVQCLGIPAILNGKSIVLASHTGSGKTLAYMLPLVQLLRKDESKVGMQTKPKRPRAVILCPTRELSEQVFQVAKSISHHARFRLTMISGGGRMKPQEDALSYPLEMLVGTPGRLLEHINQGNMFYGDIKYVVLDEADTMFDRGFGPDLRKFLNPLRNRASKPGDQGFQTVLVTATITKAVEKLLDEEFEGIVHMHTSTLHKKIASARHDFIKLSGDENKLEALLQVLEPSLAKGNKVMVFCNTLGSSRAVDHFLNENQVLTVNYHGEVPAEKRIENLNKFKSDDGDSPTLVCTDLAARGLDLAVDHVIMFDFPHTPIDYLHRTGRTARMGAKGKVTSLITKKEITLASEIEDAIRNNESLEGLTTIKEKHEARKQKQIHQKMNENVKPKERTSFQKGTKTQRAGWAPSSKLGSKAVRSSATKVSKIPRSGRNPSLKLGTQALRTSAPKNSKVSSQKTKQVNVTALGAKRKQESTQKTFKITSTRKAKGTPKVWKTEQALTSRLSVVGFKGKQKSSEKEGKGSGKRKA
ncbi:hypothetical protein SUGI_0838570 [Cryptomeria japonica]|uniref:DEAD-box ATP-dependent RNA helicase 39 n=1 Tax=Cryptomeria japonica TaxID=3369 RepID=UPI0024149B9A|nr:DEAD-box ATP-dependent RNA helicase 39 [Cryptomeria japonica]GLJ40625.1 hypothetical protein SUGI_0838570 [Cryptomeria japonica]